MSVAAQVLLWLGVATMLLSAAGAVVAHSVEEALHFLAPTGSLGAPLVAAALALRAPDPHTAFKEVLALALVAATGPVLGSATARAQRIRAARRAGEDDR